MNLLAASVCDRGLSPKRPVNEDRALVRPDRGLFVVCDGVGGHNSGEVASQLAIDTIEEVFLHYESGSIEDLLTDAVRYANRDIYEMAASQTQYDGMGTTIALLYLDTDGRRAFIHHAGDSRIYRYDGRRLHLETHDHTDLEDAVRAGRITREESLQHKKQNTINRALGIESEVVAESRTLPLSADDAFLLCSDGVTRHIDDEELEELFQEGLDAETICEEIRSRCYARGAEDNLTAVVVYTARPRQVVSEPPESGARSAAPRGGLALPTPTRRNSGNLAPTQKPPSNGVGGLVLGLTLAVGSGIGGFFVGQMVPRLMKAPQPTVQPAAAAREAFAQGEIEKARLAFTTLSQQEPNKAEYHYWLGRVALVSNESAEAIMQLEEAIKLDGSHADAHLFLAAAYQLEMKDREASEHLRRYVELRRAEGNAKNANSNGPAPPGPAQRAR